MATVKKPVVKKVPAKKAVKVVASPTAPKKVAVKASVKKVVAADLPKETGLKISVYSAAGKVVESFSLPKDLFGVDINDHLMTQAVRVFLSNQRRGTVKTKTRGEVNISTRKIYRQKGTGRARHGAASAPIFVGGGLAFGPRQRDYSMKLNQKQKRAALLSALSSKLKDGQIRVVSGLEKMDPKTKNINNTLVALQLKGKKNSVLLVTPGAVKTFDGVIKAARNIEGVDVRPSNLLNTYEVLKSKNILFTKDAITAMSQAYGGKN